VKTPVLDAGKLPLLHSHSTDENELAAIHPLIKAIKRGKISRILATNARMLCHGVIPVLMSDM
jgi:hypothetical protein